MPTSYYSATFALLQHATLEYTSTNLKNFGDQLLVCAKSGADNYTTVRFHSKEMGNLKLQRRLEASNWFSKQPLTNLTSLYDILPYTINDNQRYITATDGGLHDFYTDFSKCMFESKKKKMRFVID